MRSIDRHAGHEYWAIGGIVAAQEGLGEWRYEVTSQKRRPPSGEEVGSKLEFLRLLMKTHATKTWCGYLSDPINLSPQC